METGCVCLSSAAEAYRTDQGCMQRLRAQWPSRIVLSPPQRLNQLAAVQDQTDQSKVRLELMSQELDPRGGADESRPRIRTRRVDSADVWLKEARTTESVVLLVPILLYAASPRRVAPRSYCLRRLRAEVYTNWENGVLVANFRSTIPSCMVAEHGAIPAR